jgi:hypothetical protein
MNLKHSFTRYERSRLNDIIIANNGGKTKGGSGCQGFEVVGRAVGAESPAVIARVED